LHLADCIEKSQVVVRELWMAIARVIIVDSTVLIFTAIFYTNIAGKKY
jgi:hypothetical protein